MTGTEKMAALMRRLRIEMNGAVADAMREYGGGRQGYGLNYGVSLPTIKDVAREYAPDHELARLLWRQDVRELKIAAWSADWRAPELAEQCAMQLFWRSPAAFGVAAEWASREMPLRRLAAFYMLGKLAATDSGIADTEIAVLLNNETVFGPAATERSAVYALREIYRHRPALRGCVTDTLNRLPQETANEVRWQVEYIE